MDHLNRGTYCFMSRRIITVFFSLLLFVSLSAAYQYALANGTSAVVETGWLADNLKKTDMSLVYVADMVPDDKAKFDSAHIPGSAYVGLDSLMGALGDGSAAPDKAKFESLMGNLGISNGAHVVLYGAHGGNPFVSTAFWLMKYHGNNNISFLNGGLAKWKAEKRAATAEPAKIKPAQYKSATDESIRADSAHVLQNLNNPKVVIVDVRSAGEYKGTESPVPNKRMGHIPGAVNLDFYATNFNNNGTFKSVNDLKAAYEAKGVTKDKEIIVYCQGGVRASNTVFVLKYILGYPKVRNYVGSWGEWANRLDPAKYALEK